MGKRLAAVVIIIMMIITATGCNFSGQTKMGRNQLIVGQLTELTGDFGTGWTNGVADSSVKALLNGYQTVIYTREGTYEIDPTVVEEFHSTVNDDGSKTFYFKIHDNLEYNTGLGITAKDYAFSILLGSSPEYEALGAYATTGASYVGYDEFYRGQTESFRGVRMYSEYEFSVTVSAKELPYYYEMSLVSISPLPVSIFAPEVSIYDAGYGATLSNNFSKEAIEESVLSQRWNPTVTCGPYQLLSYDTASKQAVLTINENYQGTYDGIKPKIERLVFKKIQEATMMDELAAGSVDLITTVSGGTAINAGLDLVDLGVVDYTSYLRNGYGKLTFLCDYGPTQFASVRQAIAYCLDRNEFAAQYSGGFAQVVNGYYGLGQWQYQEMKNFIDGELNPYPMNLKKAKELLIEDGWIYNAKGEPYDEAKDEVRCKYVDGAYMPCIIQWGSVENTVAQLLATMLPEPMEEVGMKLVITSIDFSVLLNSLSKEGSTERTYHMFNMGISFPRVCDPYYYYSSERNYTAYNDNKIYDATLEQLAKELRETSSTDTNAYLTKWVAFQKRWNELLPDLPLYSDEYHEFYNKKLKNYEVAADWSASDQLVYCYIAE